MGQLVKLQDYISRYEQNIFEYPSRYVRLKKQQWEKIYQLWLDHQLVESIQPPSMNNWLEEEPSPLFNKMKGLFKRGKKEEDVIPEISLKDEQPGLNFHTEFAEQPQTEDELKQKFLDQLFRFQMKWATTTLSEYSPVNKKYQYDRRLKYFLQRFPDTVLVMYEPVFLLKKAPIEVDTILVTPTEVWCIRFLEQEESAVYIGSKERFWTKRHREKEEKILSPVLSLNRTEKIVNKIFEMYEIELPIHRLLLSRNGYIDYPTPPYGLKLVEKRNYDEWFQAIRTNRSPLKHVQLKAAQALLHYTQTTSLRRLEWDVPVNDPEQEF